MTLNVMLSSARGLYLTGDFRLTYADGRVEDDPLAQKIVPVVKMGWCALVSFSGVARISSGIDVGDWISESANAANPQESRREVLRRLLSARAWLSGLRGERRLNVTVVGYDEGRPFVTLLSNYQNMSGKPTTHILDYLEEYELPVRKDQARFFGDTGGVTRRDRQLAKSLARGAAPNAIMGELAQLNERASRRATSISPACVVGCIRPSGDGELRQYGMEPGEEYLPRFVQRGLLAEGIQGFVLRTDDDGRALKPLWRGMTFKIEGKASKDAAVGVIHALANVSEPFGAKSPEGGHVFWKIMKEGDPRTVTIDWNRGPPAA